MKPEEIQTEITQTKMIKRPRKLSPDAASVLPDGI